MRLVGQERWRRAQMMSSAIVPILSLIVALTALLTKGCKP
jgi:hypothetical protein